MSEQPGSSFSCHKCGKVDGPRIPFPPYPGDYGRSLVARICNDCWEEWITMQTRIINEYRLNVLDPGHAKAVREQMELFLGLAKPTEE